MAPQYTGSIDISEKEVAPGYEDTSLKCPLCVEEIESLLERGFVPDSDESAGEKPVFSQTPYVRIVARYDPEDTVAQKAFLQEEPYEGEVYVYCPQHEETVSLTFEGRIERPTVAEDYSST